MPAYLNPVQGQRRKTDEGERSGKGLLFRSALAVRRNDVIGRPVLRNALGFAFVAIVCILASTDPVGQFAYGSFHRIWAFLHASSILGPEREQVLSDLAQKGVHVVLFGTVGVAMAGRRLSAGALAGGILLCLAAECAQFATSTRSPQVADAFLNVISFLSGAVLATGRTSRNLG